MSEPFAAALLLSMPQLLDPNFARTVVLLCDFAPEGAFGLVLNRPTEMPATSMVKLDPPIVGGNGMPLCIGGPVEPERGWILMGTAPDEAEYREIRLAHGRRGARPGVRGRVRLDVGHRDQTARR